MVHVLVYYAHVRVNLQWGNFQVVWKPQYIKILLKKHFTEDYMPPVSVGLIQKPFYFVFLQSHLMFIIL